jgi:paired amphipathic helix protein Sin3a
MLRSTNTPSNPAPPPPLSALPPQELGPLPPSDQPAVSAPLPTTSALGLSNTPKPSGSSVDLPATDDHERQVLGPAMEYVQRIKTRFSNDPDTYKQFLEILSNYKSSANNVRSTASSSQLY